MLYTAGQRRGWGGWMMGSATTDYDEEEIARKMSIADTRLLEWARRN